MCLLPTLFVQALERVLKLFSIHFTLCPEIKFSERLKQEEAFLFSPFLIFLIVAFRVLTRQVGFLSP